MTSGFERLYGRIFSKKIGKENEDIKNSEAFSPKDYAKITHLY